MGKLFSQACQCCVYSDSYCDFKVMLSFFLKRLTVEEIKTNQKSGNFQLTSVQRFYRMKI